MVTDDVGAGLLKLVKTSTLLKRPYSPELVAELEWRHGIGGCIGKRCVFCRKLKELKKAEQCDDE